MAPGARGPNHKHPFTWEARPPGTFWTEKRLFWTEKHLFLKFSKFSGRFRLALVGKFGPKTEPKPFPLDQNL